MVQAHLVELLPQHHDKISPIASSESRFVYPEIDESETILRFGIFFKYPKCGKLLVPIVPRKWPSLVTAK
jgi:hypothetical protein